MITKRWCVVWTIVLLVRISATQDDVPANNDTVILPPLDLGGAVIPDLRGADYPLANGNQPPRTDGGPDDYLIGDYNDFGGYDNYYYDVDYPEGPPLDINATVGSSFLVKCRCSAHQVLLDNNTCINFTTSVQVIHPHTRGPNLFNTTAFKFVIARDLNCSDDFFMDHLELFAIEATGELFHYSYDRKIAQDNYCIEHILDGAGEINWKASVCLPKPILATCCGEGEVLAPGNDTCVPSKGTVTFTPPIIKEQGDFEHNQLGNPTNHDIGCTGDSVKEVELNGETAVLHYNVGAPPSLSYFNEYMIRDHASEYCLAARETEEGSLLYVARFCNQNACTNSTCVRKCCDHLMHLDNGTCVYNHDPNSGLNYTFYQKDDVSIVADTPQNINHYYGQLVHCTADKGLGVVELNPKTNPEDMYHLLDDGNLYLPRFRKGGICGKAAESYYFIDKYCMDSYIDDAGQYSEVVMFCHKELGKVKGCEAGAVLYPILMGISCVFLVLTLIVYLGVSSLRERTYGRCLCSLVISILIVYITFICNYAGILQSNASCYAAAFIGHFSGLSMFFWLSVMGFDMWSTLRSHKPQNQSKKLFTRYSLYAWGFPLLFALIALVIRLLPETEEYCHIIRPDYVNHGRGCSFNSLKTRWVYHYWVILLLVCVNTIFFVHVTITLIQAHKQAKQVLQSPNSRKSNFVEQKKKSKMWLYIKLFLVMGIAWIMEVVSFKDCGWIVGDIFNLLQGLLIFIITVCKTDVFKKIQDAWGLQNLGVGINTLRDRMTRSVAGSSSSTERVRMSNVSCSSRKTSTTTLGKPSEPFRKLSNISVGSLPLKTVHE